MAAMVTPGPPFCLAVILARAARDLERHEVSRVDSARGVIAFAALASQEHGMRAAPDARRLLAHYLRGEPLPVEAAHEAPTERAAIVPEASLETVLREGIVWREILRPPVTRV